MKRAKNIVYFLLLLVSFPVAAQRDIDTLMRVSRDAVDKVIKYKAKDSVAMDLTTRRAYLYSDGSIDYDSMLLKADIEVPNLPVAVDAWGRSACYPQGSFYPLSDGISTHIPPDH